MKNRLIKQYIAMVLVIAMSLNTISLSAKIDTQKIKDLTKRMNFLKNAHEDYKGSLREYDKCVQKNCSQEIEALKKANEDLSKIGLKDVELRNIVMGAKETADENFKQCTIKYCDDIKKNLKKSELSFSAKALAIVGAVIVVSIGLPIVGSKVSKELRMKNLIKKYGLSDKPEIRKLLSTGNVYLLEQKSISESLRDAMAEAYFGHEPSAKEKKEFDKFLDERDIVVEEVLSLR